MDDRPYTPTPRVPRPRCRNCNKVLYWDGHLAKWICFAGCGRTYARRTVE